ncbi:hypothetical protein RsoM2USA_481 [Ralstonia phage RsoM2USA]|nr:hypothetical protein RsoM2USA_481 [Ralstonia phage RsoM2USA]
MPYITTEQRKKLDVHILNLVNAIYDAAHPSDESAIEGDLASLKATPGLVNYAVSTLLKSIYDQRESYASYNAQIGVLECIKLELYRKFAAPYEDQKEYENGEVKALYSDNIEH